MDILQHISDRQWHMRFQHHVLYTSLMLALPYVALAENQPFSGSIENPEKETTVLQSVTVKGRAITRKTAETTGLGKTVKNSQDLNRSQTLSIRDLVRDTPGIGVVEQGRGASSGYAIRGVDKNRVAVTVDGIPQIQSYLVQKRNDGREGSGAINEIELENVSSVQFSQGASSSESGSGSLGGAVGFRTKTVDDFIQDGHQTGLTYKTAYSSKDKQILHSFGGAFRSGKLEGLIQYTNRNKSETEVHKDIGKVRYEVERYAGYPEDFANGSAKPSAIASNIFAIGSECATFDASNKYEGLSGCTVKPMVVGVDAPHRTVEMMDAKTYTGDKRIMPDPMKYQSASWLAKLGYRFSPEHRIDTILEHTTQQYDTRDMTETAYHLADSNPTKKGSLRPSKGIYRGTNYTEGLQHLETDGIGMLWNQTRFFDEQHTKKRYGLHYHYQGHSQTWLDSASLQFDHQDISINHFQINKYCSPYPHADRNCQVSLDKPGSAEQTERKIYREKHQTLRADFNKTFGNAATVRNHVHISAGWDKFSSNLWIGDLNDVYARLMFNSIGDFVHPEDIGKNTRRWVTVYEPTLLMEQSKNNCQGRTLARACGDRLITGQNLYFSGSNTLSFKRIFNISTGLRFDRHTFQTDDKWTGSGRFSNWSWNVGLEWKPNEHIDLMYRMSSGYRVPSFKELFGYRVDGYEKGSNDKDHYVTDVKPERALNRELGIALKSDLGRFEASYFDNQYRDLIDETQKDGKLGYRNFQDARIKGINLSARLDLHSLWNSIPDGLFFTANYGHTKVSENKIKEGFQWGRSYFMDSISPARYVIGLDYTHPDEKWGANMVWTVSKAKKASELHGTVTSAGKTYTKKATDAFPSKGWRTLDVSAFYRPLKNVTLRGAIYNLTNYRYIQWESLRQTAVTSGNQHTQGFAAQYAAPGRNFVLGLEAKF